VIKLPPNDRVAFGSGSAVAISPDGSRLVFVASRASRKELFVVQTRSPDPAVVPDTEGADSPFFSPDGKSVGFFAQGKLKLVSLSGGLPVTLCSSPVNRGATWGPDGSIIFSPSTTAGLFRIPSAGGTPVALTVPDRAKGEFSHRWPELLPGGKAVLFTVFSGTTFDQAKIDVLSLETGRQRVILKGGSYPRYVAPGYLVYARTSGLQAVPFDSKRLTVTGPPTPVAEGVSINPFGGAADFSISAEGSLAYVPGGARGSNLTLWWVDRKGGAQPVPAPARGYISPRLAPDDRRLAIGIQGSNPGVWIYDLSRGTLTLLAETVARIPAAIWMPGGKGLTFRSLRRESDGSVSHICEMPVYGGSMQRLTTGEAAQYPGSWSADGRVLAFSQLDPATGWDIWLLRPAAEPKLQSFLQTPADERGAVLSPDGDWVAYESDETGRQEVYVRSFADRLQKWQVSTDGGTEPMWARNGHELFYRAADKMMSVSIQTAPTLGAGKPQLLFEGRYETGNGFVANYDVDLEGQRFLMIKASEQEAEPKQLNVILGWIRHFKGSLPSAKK
jgi:Tol biopolymer transport system component